MEMDREKIWTELGLLPKYYDLDGNLHELDEKSALALLVAMGWEEEEAEDPKKLIAMIRLSDSARLLDHIYFLEGEEKEKWIRFRWPYLNFPEDCFLKIETEQGISIEIPLGLSKPDKLRGECSHRRFGYKIRIEDPIDLGYHKLSLHNVPGRFEGVSSVLVIHPEKCYSTQEQKKKLGVSVQLYAVRSELNDGIGDFRDLQALANYCYKSGYRVLSINPIHFPYPIPNPDFSPYFSWNRFFKDYLYVHLPWVFKDLSLPKTSKRYFAERDKFHKKETSGKYINFESVHEFKLGYLYRAYSEFISSNAPTAKRNMREFLLFVSEKGESLLSHAYWTEKLSADRFYERKSIQSNIKSENTEKTSKKKDYRNFIYFLAWITEVQWVRVLDYFKERNLILFGDLAVGSDPNGPEVRSFSMDFASSARVGAPSDLFSPAGQNWGVPPSIPRRMVETGFEHFIQLVRNNMIEDGMLRIDHALGLFRLYWIPQGSKGGYISYPSEYLLKILALESHRKRCVLVAEDLGNVPTEIKEKLMDFGLYSFRVLYFEQRHGEGFIPPDRYPPRSVSVHNTHDLPTLKGYWDGFDIEFRKRTSLWDEETSRAYSSGREKEKREILNLLKNEKIFVEEEKGKGFIVSLRNGMFELLERTSSEYSIFSLHDILMDEEQANFPGTSDEYPNWKIRYSKDLRELDLYWGYPTDTTNLGV
ncbi:4-alpha-glucanotransferase [Leptospira licerasiae]|nr:4-alpha-glucanotransferase [Leptospira licerasiae]